MRDIHTAADIDPDGRQRADKPVGTNAFGQLEGTDASSERRIECRLAIIAYSIDAGHGLAQPAYRRTTLRQRLVIAENRVALSRPG